MSPYDRTFQFKTAFEKAEQAWLKWRKSPLGDAEYEEYGVVVLQAFIDAGAAYLNFARQHTGVRRHDPARYARDTGLLLDGQREWDAGLHVPAFLRRQAD